MAPKPHTWPGEAPLPQCPARGASICAPAHCGSPALPACTAHSLPFPPGAQGCQRSPGPAGPWRQGGTAAPRGAPCPLLPPNPSTSQPLAARPGCLGRGRQGRPVLGVGAGSAPTLSPCALSSWWRTAAEWTSTWTRACRTCRAPRSPCARQPSRSLVSRSPAGHPSLPRSSLVPATAAAESTGRLQSPDCPMRDRAPTGLPAGLCHPCPHHGGWWDPCWVPRSRLGLHARGTALGSVLPKGRRARGQARGAGGGELGCWGGQASRICDGLCVPRARWAAAEGWAPGEAPGHLQG